jgi:hypothetical protein
VEATTKILTNGRYRTYSVEYSTLYYWVYEYNIGAPLLTSGSVDFQTLGSNAIGWGLSATGSSCQSQSVILDSSHQQTSSQIYLNFVQNNREVYFGSTFLGIVTPLQYLNQTFQSLTEITETSISYCNPLSESSEQIDCVDTPEGSAVIPSNSSIFFINYLLNKRIPDGPSNATSPPSTNHSEILIFIPFGESDYSYAEDDLFDEDYNEPPLSAEDWTGIALGILTAGLLLLGILFFFKSMRKKSSLSSLEIPTESSSEQRAEAQDSNLSAIPNPIQRSTQREEQSAP